MILTIIGKKHRKVWIGSLIFFENKKFKVPKFFIKNIEKHRKIGESTPWQRMFMKYRKTSKIKSLFVKFKQKTTNNANECFRTIGKKISQKIFLWKHEKFLCDDKKHLNIVWNYFFYLFRVICFVFLIKHRKT